MTHTAGTWRQDRGRAPYDSKLLGRARRHYGQETAVQVVASLVLSVVLFLFLQAFASAASREWLRGQNNFLVVTGILQGFTLLAILVGLIVLSMFSMDDKPEMYVAVGLATLTTVLAWVLVTWGYVLAFRPDLLLPIAAGKLWWERWAAEILAIPQYAAVFAVEVLPLPIYYWYANMGTFHVVLGISLYLRRRSYKHATSIRI